MKILSFTALSLAATLFSFASPANATTIDTFTLTHKTDVLSFVLSSQPGVGGTCFTALSGFCTTVNVNVNGTTSPLEVDFLTSTNGGGLIIAPLSGLFQTTVNGGSPSPGFTPLFTGTISNPTFKLGTFNLVNNTYTTNEFKENFSLAVVQSTVAATPEPSSLALLGTGLLGLGAFVRRRLFPY